MGFLDFFKNSPEKEIKEIELEALDEWADSLVKKKLESKKPELEKIKEEIYNEIKTLRDNIDKLRNSELKNPDIPDRAKHIMEGNRKIYVEKTESLLNEIEFPNDFENILEFHSAFDEYLNIFTNSTEKSYNVLQEFFVNEINVISGNLRKLDYLITKKMKKISEDAKLRETRELKNKISEIINKKDYEERINKKISSSKKALQKMEKEKKEKTKQIEAIEESDEYREFLDLINEKNILEEKTEKAKKEMNDSFSILKPALKKYERLSLKDKLIRKYLEDPVKALLEDEDLEITEVIDKMMESIRKGELELKEDKKNKILGNTDRFNNEYFKDFLENYNNLSKKLNELKNKIGEIKLADEIEKIKKEQSLIDSKIKENEFEINKTIKKLDEIDIGNSKKELEKDIIENIGERILVL